MRAMIAAALLAVVATSVHAQDQDQDQPNILVLWGDDIGNTNISANTHGAQRPLRPNAVQLSDLPSLLGYQLSEVSDNSGAVLCPGIQ